MNAFIVLDSKLEEVENLPVVSPTKHKVIWSLLLMVSEANQRAVLLGSHGFKRHNVLKGMHIVSVPHKDTRNFWFSSQSNNCLLYTSDAADE